MSEIILGVLLLAILIYHAWYVNKHDDHVEILIQGILAKDVYEYNHGKDKKKKPEEETKPDLIPVSQLDNDTYFKAVNKTLELSNEEDKTLISKLKKMRK